jgi:hypothetical protein
MSDFAESFMSDFFNALSEPRDRKPSGKPRILSKVRNGKGWLWHCQDTDTYWRSLKSCRMLSPTSQRVNNPKHLVPSNITVQGT